MLHSQNQFEVSASEVDGRASDRHAVALVTEATHQNGSFSVTVDNISASGARIRTGTELKLGDALQFIVGPDQLVTATVVREDKHVYGVDFERRIKKSAVSAAILRSPFSCVAAVNIEGPAVEIDESGAPALARGIVIAAALSLPLWALIALGVAALI